MPSEAYAEDYQIELANVVLIPSVVRKAVELFNRLYMRLNSTIVHAECAR